MNEEKIIPFRFTRQEIVWLYRHLLAELAEEEVEIKKYTGELNEEQNAKLTALTKQRDELTSKTTQLRDRLLQGDKERLNLFDVGKNLRESLDMADSEEHKAIIQKRLDELPTEEFYLFEINYKFAKYILSLLERGLHHFKTQVIPNHLKEEESKFGNEDPILTKSFITKLKYKEKNELEQLKLKFERAL